MNNKIRDIVRLSVIATMYVILTVINPFSYNMIQIRISEVLIFLCFFKKDYCIALIIGCFISNLFSEFMLYDIIFGTLATALACICIMYSKNIYLSMIYPIIFNSIIIGLELFIFFNTPLFINMVYVAIGESIVILLGVIIFNKLRSNKSFMELIQANQNV